MAGTGVPTAGTAGTGGAVGGTGGASGGSAGGGSGGTGGSVVNPGAYSLLITLDTSAAGANVSESVDNYPLAVQLDATNFDFTQAGTMGEDITFETADGTLLPHSIEHWDSVAGSAALWVKVPQVVGNMAGQQLRMRWGTPGAVSTADSKAVFSKADGFFGVWHLDEDGNTTADGYKDASEHEAHGTGVNMIAGSRVDARIGKGQNLDNQDGQDTARWIRVEGEKTTAYDPGPAITVTVWALAHSYPISSYETIMCKGDTSWSLQRVQYAPNNGYQSCLYADSISNHFCVYDFEQQPLVTEEWLHFMVVLEEPSMTLYINGEEAGGGSLTEWVQADNPLGIGNQTQFEGRRQWDGILDEARVMQAARSQSWAKLDYESQREAQTLITYTPE
jgi:biopolymer transport protein ExbB